MKLEGKKVLYIAEIIEGLVANRYTRDVAISRKYRNFRVVRSTTRSLTPEGLLASTNSSIRETQIDSLPRVVSTRRTLIYSWSSEYLESLVESYLELLETHCAIQSKRIRESLDLTERSLKNLKERSRRS